MFSLKINEVGMLPDMALYLSAVFWINLGQCLRWKRRQMWPMHIFLLCGTWVHMGTHKNHGPIQQNHLKPNDLDSNLWYAKVPLSDKILLQFAKPFGYQKKKYIF